MPGAGSAPSYYTRSHLNAVVAVSAHPKRERGGRLDPASPGSVEGAMQQAAAIRADRPRFGAQRCVKQPRAAWEVAGRRTFRPSSVTVLPLAEKAAFRLLEAEPQHHGTHTKCTQLPILERAARRLGRACPAASARGLTRHHAAPRSACLRIA